MPKTDLSTTLWNWSSNVQPHFASKGLIRSMQTVDLSRAVVVITRLKHLNVTTCTQLHPVHIFNVERYTELFCAVILTLFPCFIL